MKFNIIGAGNLGKNLAFALQRHGVGELGAICNRNLQSALAATAAVGAGLAVGQLAELVPAQLTFITTPDDVIASVVTTLVSEKILSAGSTVVHCSGALSSEVLMPLQDSGCYIASMHPLKAFRAHSLDEDIFQGCDCVVEGDALALELLTPLLTRLGANVMLIAPANKSLYHAAAVMASNYLVTLAGCAVNLLEEAGFSDQQALQMTRRLMQSSLDNVQKNTRVEDALTGPLARGDAATISRHLQVIRDHDIHELYRVAGLATLALASHDSETLALLKRTLA